MGHIAHGVILPMGSHWPWGHIDHGVTLTVWSHWPWGHIDNGVTLTVGSHGPWVTLTMWSHWPWVKLTMGSHWPWVTLTMGSHWPWGHIDHGAILTVGSHWPWGHIDRGVTLTVGSHWPWGHIDHRVTLTMDPYWPWGHIDHEAILTMGPYWPWVSLTIGSYWPHLRNRIKAQFITMFISPNNILQHGLYSNIDRQTRLCLGTFEYTEADTENGLQNPNNIPQHSICQYLTISHTVSLSVALCLSLYVMLRSARHRTSQKNKLYYMEGTVGSIWPYCGGQFWPQAEININKK
jgi:hypothetical protein